MRRENPSQAPPEKEGECARKERRKIANGKTRRAVSDISSIARSRLRMLSILSNGKEEEVEHANNRDQSERRARKKGDERDGGKQRTRL